jgi:hypothetical protein
MYKAHVVRRIFHLCAPAFLVYYLIPEDMWGLGISPEISVIVVLITVLSVEAFRLATGRTYYGLRTYEKNQISAYAWAAIGITIAFLFFPPVFVICAVVGLGWVDPLIGELRRHWKKANPTLPLVMYFMIVMGSLLLFSDINFITQVFLGCLASVSAIKIEAWKTRYVDDDFLMLIIPLMILTFVYGIMTFTGITS